MILAYLNLTFYNLSEKRQTNESKNEVNLDLQWNFGIPRPKVDEIPGKEIKKWMLEVTLKH